LFLNFIIAGLKKLSSFVRKDKWLTAFLNVMCLLKHVLNCEQHFSYFNPVYTTYGLIVTGLQPAATYREFDKEMNHIPDEEWGITSTCFLNYISGKHRLLADYRCFSEILVSVT
jgi:hypothetical protein